MGESTGRKPYEQVLSEAYERFEEAEDFTVSVEEEFALLDPETLDLVNRFEDVQAAVPVSYTHLTLPTILRV